MFGLFAVLVLNNCLQSTCNRVLRLPERHTDGKGHYQRSCSSIRCSTCQDREERQNMLENGLRVDINQVRASMRSRATKYPKLFIFGFIT